MKNLTYTILFFAVYSCTNLNEAKKSTPPPAVEIPPKAVNECEKIAETVIENAVKSMQSTEEMSENRRMMLVAVVQKDCESGKFDRNCMKTAKNIYSIAELCKK